MSLDPRHHEPFGQFVPALAAYITFDQGWCFHDLLPETLS